MRPFGVVASIGQAGGPIPPLDVEELGPRRSIMLARSSVMAYMNDAAADHAAQAVLAAIATGIFKGVGLAYVLRDAAKAHIDLESGRSSGALYPKV